MQNIEKVILNKLLDKYENSKTFLNENKVQQRFSIKVETLFPKYKDHSNYEVFEAVNEGVSVLVRKRYVVATITKAKVVKEVTLETHHLDQIYKYIKRVPKKDIHHSLETILTKYMSGHGILQAYCNNQLQRIEANKPIQFFNGNLDEFNDVLYATKHVLLVEKETYVRDLSIKLFSDSKKFEKLSSKVINLLYEYGDFPEKHQVLETLNVIKNPTYVHFKGAGTITLSNQSINLSLLSSDIGISSSMIDDIKKINIETNIVMSVENLTTFNKLNKENMFLIYLGGFHNTIRRDFIKKIAEQNPEVEFYHFGDIDAGGFYIFEHLTRLTGINFKPFKMDLATLKQHQKYSKPLSENDRARLGSFKGEEFLEVIDYMLENNCKLEQEAIDFLD